MDFLEFEDFLAGNKEKKAPTWRIPGHLKQPIIPDEVDYILKNLDRAKFQCKRHRLVRDMVKREKITKSIYTTCPSPWICLQEYIKHDKELRKGLADCKEELKLIMKTSVLNYVIQKTNFINSTDYFNMETLRKDLEGIANDREIQTAYILKRVTERIKDKITEREFEIGEFLQGTNKLIAEKEVFLFECPAHGKCLGPTSLLLGVLDICQTRFSLLVYWKLCDYFEKYKGKSLYKRGTQLIRHIEKLQQSLGEGVFKVLKNWESFVVGRICANPVLDTGFDGLLKTSIASIKEVIPDFLTSKLHNLWIRNTTDDNEVKMSLELTALCKNFGHPCINHYDGMEEICELASEKLEIDAKVCREVRCTFTKTFIKSYLEKNKKWPNLSFKYIPNLEIFSAYSQNRWLTTKEYDSVQLDDWDVIEFKKTFEFDYSVNTTELLSDKSNAPRLSHWTQKYDPCGFADNGQVKPKITPDPTRVILRYLEGRPGETREVIEEVESGRPDPENNICILCRKERELKEKGRLFCEQTYRQRLLQTSLENNIKKYIFPYIRQQTMSDSELGLKRKISEILKIPSKNGCDIINLDLYRWNMLQRHESNRRIANDIENLFGLKMVYKDSHLWMQRTFVLNNSRLYPPLINPKTGLPVPGQSCHINQYGGFEGMRQKLWTLVTLCSLLCVAEQLRIRINMVGQGDNVVIAVKWSLHHLQNLEYYRTLLINAIYRKINGLGLKLKKEETWISTRLFQYGKVSYFRGTSVSNGTKRAMRIISDEHDGIPTFETSMCMISTATENISNNDWTPDCAFIVYGLEILSLFFRKNILRLPQDSNTLLICLLWSNIFGGLPLSNYSNHSIRGIDDKLTSWVSVLRQVKLFLPNTYDKFFVVADIKKRKDTDLGRLVKDIYSINVTSLKTAGLTAKEIVKESIPLFTTNREVLDILELGRYQTEHIMVKLISVRPFFPPLLHELYRNSNAGLIYNIQNRLTNVQTIVKVARAHIHKDPYQAIESANQQLLQTIKRRFNFELITPKTLTLHTHPIPYEATVAAC